MRKFLIIGAAAIAFAPAAAFAQTGGSWTGAHVDAIVGWDQVKNDDPSIPGNPYKKDGVAYGGQVGYDIDMGGMVVGVEGEYAGSTVKDCVTSGATDYCLKAGRDLYAGARLGAAVGDTRDTLLYLKGGYVNGRAKFESTTGGVTTTTSNDSDGFRVGAGVEHRFGENMSAKVEYRYSDYGSFNKRNQIVFGMGFRF